MDFGWLKRIFKKKSLSNVNTSDLATIDTSFIHVPKLSELTSKNRILVEKYIEELKDKDNNYKLILKYSDELLNKSNSEIEFFMLSLDDILKDISSVINEVNKENYFKLLINKEEIKQSIDEFYKIIEEARLRLLALDTYIKKEELRKYDFLGVFGKAERLRYLNDKTKLLNERERLKTTIKISSQHLLAVFKALKEEDVLLNNMEMYISSSKSFDTKYCDNRVCYKYVTNLLEKKKLYDIENCGNLKYLVGICDICEGVLLTNGEECFIIDNIKATDFFLCDLEYKRLVPFLAKENREIKKYAFEHRNDYKKIIEEINEVVKKYQTTSSSKWNINELEMTIRKYASTATNYVIICNMYLIDDILKELRESLFNLNYFFNISEVRRNNKSCNMSPLGKSLIVGEYTRSIIKYGNIKNCNKVIHDLLEKIDGWNWEYQDEKKYYDKLSCEMLKTVGILNLPLIDYQKMERKIERVVKELKDKEELHYLFDIYNQDYDTFDLNLNEYGYNNRVKKHSGIYVHFNLKVYLQKLSRKYFNNNSFCHLSYEDDIVSLDDIYYLDIFLNNIGWILYGVNIDELFNDEYGFAQGMNKELFKLMVHSYFKNIDREYDNRLLIIPRQIIFNQVLDYKQLLKSTDTLNIKDNNIAIYLTNWSQVISITELLKNEKSNVKYLMMSDDLYKSYKDAFGYDLMQKIIKVPNHTRYNALSSYLDQELAKEHDQQTVLSKSL